MKIKSIRVVEQYEDEKTNEYEIVIDHSKSVYENALNALKEVEEKEYFSEAEIISSDDADIYTHDDYSDILSENEKEYIYSWYGIKYGAGVEISIITEE